MNCLIIYPEELSENKALLRGSRAAEISERHKLSLGLDIKAGVYNGKLGRAKVVSLGDSIELEFTPEESPPVRLPVRLICGLSRPQTVKKVIQSSILYGIEELHFVSTELGEKSYQDSKIWEPANLAREIELGLEQAIDTVAPEIILHSKFHEFVNDHLDSLLSESQSSFLADTAASPNAALGDFEEEVLLAVGPEAGWSDKEISIFLDKGFEQISLGPRMLRVESAVTGLLGAAQLGLG